MWEWLTFFSAVLLVDQGISEVYTYTKLQIRQMCPLNQTPYNNLNITHIYKRNTRYEHFCLWNVYQIWHISGYPSIAIFMYSVENNFHQHVTTKAFVHNIFLVLRHHINVIWCHFRGHMILILVFCIHPPSLAGRLCCKCKQKSSCHLQVLVLKELAISTPTFFFQQVQQFFDYIFNAVRDSKVNIYKEFIKNDCM